MKQAKTMMYNKMTTGTWAVSNGVRQRNVGTEKAGSGRQGLFLELRNNRVSRGV